MTLVVAPTMPEARYYMEAFGLSPDSAKAVPPNSAYFRNLVGTNADVIAVQTDNEFPAGVVDTLRAEEDRGLQVEWVGFGW